MALALGVPFLTVRKKGKLPWRTVSHKYDLEYGSAEVEMHVDSVRPGMNVMVHDDLLATGGTAAAAAELIERQGGTVSAFSFLIDLSFLKGLDRLATLQCQGRQARDLLAHGIQPYREPDDDRTGRARPM